MAPGAGGGELELSPVAFRAFGFGFGRSISPRRKGNRARSIESLYYHGVFVSFLLSVGTHLHFQRR
jgi:hypothetical protein